MTKQEAEKLLTKTVAMLRGITRGSPEFPPLFKRANDVLANENATVGDMQAVLEALHEQMRKPPPSAQ